MKTRQRPPLSTGQAFLDLESKRSWCEAWELFLLLPSLTEEGMSQEMSRRSLNYEIIDIFQLPSV